MHKQSSFKVTWIPHDHRMITWLTSESLQTQAPGHFVTNHLHGLSHDQTGHRMTNHLPQTFHRTHVDLMVWPSTNCVHYCGRGYSNRFVWLCRVCARYPHYGVLPPSSTSKLFPQEPWNLYRRSGLGLLQRDRSTACPSYPITNIPSWVAQCPPDIPAIAWQPTIAWSKTSTVVAKLSQTGTGPISTTGSQDYRRLPSQGNCRA